MLDLLTIVLSTPYRQCIFVSPHLCSGVGGEGEGEGEGGAQAIGGAPFVYSAGGPVLVTPAATLAAVKL